MTSSTRRTLATAAVLVGAPLLLGACSKSNETSTGTAGAGATSTSASTPATAVNQGPVIEIKDRAFEPKDATAKVGEIVTWTNLEEGVAHTITEDKPDAERTIKSPKVAAGESYTLTFMQPGTYNYICSIHPSAMKGTITVTA